MNKIIGLVVVIAAVIAVSAIGFYVFKSLLKSARNMVGASLRKIGELLRLLLDWMRWTLGVVFIIVSGCFALASIFLGSWVDISFIFWHLNSLTGLAIGVTVLLGIWIYPVFRVFMGRPLNKKWAGWAAVFAVLVAIAFMVYVRSRSGILIHAAPGFGVGMFLIAGIFLLLGVVLYKPKLINLLKTTTSILSGSPCPEDARTPSISDRGRGFYYFCNDDQRMHVITYLYHAVGQAKFMLEPKLNLEANYGLAPWAIREVEYLVRHHENAIRDAWNKYFPSPIEVSAIRIECDLADSVKSGDPLTPNMQNIPPDKSRVCGHCSLKRPLEDFLSKHIYVNRCRKCRLLEASTISV